MSQANPYSARRRFLQMSLISAAVPWLGCARRLTTPADVGSEKSSGNLSRRAQTVHDDLIEFLEQLTIIDAHEHLFPERLRNARQLDVLTLLHNYEAYDLASAGFGYQPGGENTGAFLLDGSIPLAERWRRIEPFLNQIRHGSYFRAAAIGLRDLHGIDRLDHTTYEEASRRMQAANKPGYYHEVLRKRCGIEVCLVQNGQAGDQDPPELFRPVVMAHQLHYMLRREGVEATGREFNLRISSLGDYLSALDQRLAQYRAAGGVGIKTWIQPRVAMSETDARKDFEALLSGAPSTPALEQFILEHCLTRCAAWDWPVAVHTGVWWDFRAYDVRHCIDLVTQHPGVRFDIYHLGIPSPIDAMLIAKNFRNAHLNLCWTYLVSEQLTEQSIPALLDMVPTNKVMGFGGDLLLALESVYGHLQIARGVLARAFAARIASGRLDLADAKAILKQWMYDNPSQFYGLHAGDHCGSPRATAASAMTPIKDPGCPCLQVASLNHPQTH